MICTVDLDRTICPGCGLTGQDFKLNNYGVCSNCDYETDSESFPTIKELVFPSFVTPGNNIEYNNVRLDLFLKTLLTSGGNSGIMDGYLEILETEIETQRRLLTKYISHEQWQNAGRQLEYINGLAQALHLAMAFYVATAKNPGDTK